MVSDIVYLGCGGWSADAPFEPLVDDFDNQFWFVGNEGTKFYFLTDLDRPGWAPQRSAAAVTEFHRQTAAVAQVASLSVIDVGQPTAENVALTGLRAREPVVSVGRTVTLETTLKNFGRQPRSQQPVALWIDGRRRDQKHVDLAAGAEAGGEGDGDDERA